MWEVWHIREVCYVFMNIVYLERYDIFETYDICERYDIFEWERYGIYEIYAIQD